MAYDGETVLETSLLISSFNATGLEHIAVIEFNKLSFERCNVRPSRSFQCALQAGWMHECIPVMETNKASEQTRLVEGLSFMTFNKVESHLQNREVV